MLHIYQFRLRSLVKKVSRNVFRPGAVNYTSRRREYRVYQSHVGSSAMIGFKLWHGRPGKLYKRQAGTPHSSKQSQLGGRRQQRSPMGTQCSKLRFLQRRRWQEPCSAVAPCKAHEFRRVTGLLCITAETPAMEVSARSPYFHV